MSFPAMQRFVQIVLVLLTLCASSYAQTIRVNEIFADNRTNIFSDGSITDWVELYNTSAQDVGLAGYSLTDSTATPRKWVFPANVTIRANGYLVVLLDSNRAASTTAGPVLNAGFGIRATGDRIELYSAGAQLVESVRFGPQAANYTIGRIGRPTGTGEFVLTRPTPAAGNVSQELGPQAALRINEWMASPSSGSDWFELYNPGTFPVQLTGLYFTDNNNEPSPVAPYSFIGAGLNGFLQIFADNSTNDNEVDFGLGGGGDSIGLYFANTTLIDRVQFGQQTANIAEGRLPDGSGTIRSLNTPTPGESNLIRYEGLVVNELLSHTDLPLEDAVEFYNQTANALNIGGWYLSNSRDDLKRFRVPDGTTVPARGYIVFYEYQFNGPFAQTPFTFNSSQGDQVYLAQAVGGELSGFIVTESFEAAENGVSFGRVETSVPGDYKFVAQSARTFGVANPTTVEQFRTGTGAANSGPRIGPIVINEIMYNPVSPDGVTDNTLEEYIELANISSSSVSFFDPAHPENRWIVRGGVNYTFPANTSIAPSEFVLLVSFDPADTTQLSAFRAKYSIPQSVRVFGPYLGKLGNGGDEVELYKPDAPQPPGRPDAGFVPYIRVDKVNYSDAAPWPTAADGTGKSLQRKSFGLFGNDPLHWDAADPTAGRSNSAEVADSDGDGMPNLWEQQNGLNPADPADGALDPDADGFSNVHEYIAGTDPRSAASRLQIAQISHVPGTNFPAVLQFGTVPGKSYSLQYRNSLQPSTVWQSLLSTNATGTNLTVQDEGSLGRQQRFYRVVTPAAD